MVRPALRLLVLALSALLLTACAPDERTQATEFLTSAMDAADSYRHSHGTYPHSAHLLRVPGWDGEHTVTAVTSPSGGATCLELHTQRGTYAVYSTTPGVVFEDSAC